MAVVLPYFSKNGRGSRSFWGGCLEPWRPPTRLHSFHYFCPGRGAIYLLLLHHFILSCYEFNWKVVWQCVQVVHAVVGKVPLLFDGGVRRGTGVQGVSPRCKSCSYKNHIHPPLLTLKTCSTLVAPGLVLNVGAGWKAGYRRPFSKRRTGSEVAGDRNAQGWVWADNGPFWLSSVKDITRSHVRTQSDHKLHSILQFSTFGGNCKF